MHIVVVDPSRTVRKAISVAMQPWGYEITGLSDAPEALEYVRKRSSVRTLMISSELPSGSGIKLCHDVRKLYGALRPLYVLLMSSRTENLVPALESGADDFVSKPPSLEELKARLRTAERVTAIQAELINRASTDHLTGMMTRRRFFEAATQVWAESPSRICILLCDLDNFKYVNDRHGHEIGDKLLVEVGKLLVATGAAAGRLGGEEFAILCQAGKSESLKLAASIREAVARITIPADTGYVRATCSIGVAERVMDESIDVLLKRADLALYQAKSAGRNRVIEAVTPFRSSIASIPRQNRCMLLEQGC